MQVLFHDEFTERGIMFTEFALGDACLWVMVASLTCSVAWFPEGDVFSERGVLTVHTG